MSHSFKYGYKFSNSTWSRIKCYVGGFGAQMVSNLARNVEVGLSLVYRFKRYDCLNGFMIDILITYHLNI